MLAEWSAECAEDDPVLVVPWDDPDDEQGPRFVDLRENPYDLDHLPEAQSHPPLMQALRSLNAPRSPVFTAKCDAWPLSAEERQQLAFALPVEEQAAGFASYIDLVPRERSVFTSFHQQEQLLSRLSRRVEALDHPDAAIDCILRPALIDLTGPQQGWSISLYVKALGPDSETAWQRWAAALDDTVATLRGRDFSHA
jgi:hypothetical protein